MLPFLTCCKTEGSPFDSKLQLFSLDAGAHAAAHSEFLEMSWRLIIGQSGLPNELSKVVSTADQLLSTCAETVTDCLDKARGPVMEHPDLVCWGWRVITITLGSMCTVGGSTLCWTINHRNVHGVALLPY